MTKIISEILLLAILLQACSDNSKGSDSNVSNIDSIGHELGMSKEIYYLHQMKVRNFQFAATGPCQDVDYNRDSITYDPITESIKQTDSSTIIHFKVIETCCQYFLGTYSIEQDTLKFIYEQVNDEACGCECWYKFKLTVNEPHTSFKSVKILRKKRLLTSPKSNSAA